MENKNIEMRCTQGSSNKVYKVSLERVIKDDDNHGWIVNFAYGPYGKSLTTGTKTPRPLSFEKANALYSKLVDSKARKGYEYTSGGNKPLTFDVVAAEKTFWLPQLLNPIKATDLLQVYNDFKPECYVQIKHDGERRGIIYSPNVITPANRKGLKTTVAPEIMPDLIRLFEGKPWKGVMDCEDMGTHLRIFDIIPQDDNTDWTFAERSPMLDLFKYRIVNHSLHTLIIEEPVLIKSYSQLNRYAENARLNNEEGIVIRDGKGVYRAGKPNSGGCALKLKFWASATCRVHSVHDLKRSVALELWNISAQTEDSPFGNWIRVGNCTIPSNYGVPSKGTLVEVKYLYAYPGGSLYQPQYKGVRPDLTIEAANILQLEYKK